VDKPELSKDFTVEDIHKIGEYHYELTKDMTVEQRATFHHDGETLLFFTKLYLPLDKTVRHIVQ